MQPRAQSNARALEVLRALEQLMPADRELRVGLLDKQPRPPSTLQAPDLVAAVAATSQPGLQPIGLLE